MLGNIIRRVKLIQRLGKVPLAIVHTPYGAVYNVFEDKGLRTYIQTRDLFCLDFPLISKFLVWLKVI